jgi:hypothetical protein
MALDTSINTVTVTGTFVDFEGNAIVGQVRFVLSSLLRNPAGDQIVVPSTVTKTLDSNGSFTVALPATDDTDVIPNFTYTVQETFTKGRTYTLSLPVATVGNLDLADVSPDTTATPVVVSLVLEPEWTALTANIDNLDTEINQTSNVFLFSGRYWYVNSQYASYSLLNASKASYTLMNSGTYQVEGTDASIFVSETATYASNALASRNTANTIYANLLNRLLLFGG